MDHTQLDAAWRSRSAFMNESKRHRQQRAVREAQEAVQKSLTRASAMKTSLCVYYVCRVI
eukprot:544717-Prymnesium_polylepis.1